MPVALEGKWVMGCCVWTCKEVSKGLLPTNSRHVSLAGLKFKGLGGQGGQIMRSGVRDQPGQHGETPSLLKIQNISKAWWHTPVAPATQGAEAEPLESGRQGLQ